MERIWSLYQFVVLKPLSCCFEETTGFDKEASSLRIENYKLIQIILKNSNSLEIIEISQKNLYEKKGHISNE